MSGDPVAWTLRQRIATSRGQIAWAASGSGTPVVLVHGTPGRSVLWRNIAPVLAEQFTVYVFDLLGFAQSERDVEQEVSVRVHGQVLAELVRHIPTSTRPCRRTFFGRSSPRICVRPPRRL